MNDVDIEIRNYRSFGEKYPLKFTLNEKSSIAFVGPNNAGKSNILKFFFEYRNLFTNLKNGGTLVNACNGKPLTSEPNRKFIEDPKEAICFNTNRPIKLKITFHEPPIDDPQISNLKEIELSTLDNIYPFNWSISRLIDDKNNKAILKDCSIRPNHRIKFNNIGYEINYAHLEKLSEILEKTIYIPAFRNAISEGSGEYYDVKIGTGFIQEFKNWKSGPTLEKNKAIINLTKTIETIFSYKNLNIDVSEDNKKLHFTIDDEPMRLSSLGSGISEFVIILANALIKEPSFVLIDEPELHLHPSLQQIFISTLSSFSKNGVLFSTHSIGLARSIADRVYSLQQTVISDKKYSLMKIFEATTNYTEFLGEMNYSAYKELGCERVLLVEGTSDVKTFIQLLRLYDIEHKIVVMPLGGSSLINPHSVHEMNEIVRLVTAEKLHVIIDSERESKHSDLDESRKTFVNICMALNLDILVTDRRATENYLVDAAIKKEKGDNYNALGLFDKLKDKNPHWDKSENWRIAGRMKREDIHDTDIGKFLEKISLLIKQDTKPICEAS